MLVENSRFIFWSLVALVVLVPVLQIIPLDFMQLQTVDAAGNIVLNGTKTTNGTVTSAPYQITLSNFNAGTNGSSLLVVGVQANNQSVNSITFRGVPLTQAVGSFYHDYTAFWYLANPSGRGNITVTMSGPTAVIVGAYSFYGVDQENPIPTTATSFKGSGNPTISLTTVYPNSYVLDLPSIYGGSTLSSPTCTQKWNIRMINQITGTSSSKPTTSAGPVTCSWTNSASSNGWDDSAIEIKAAGTFPPATPITLHGKSTAAGSVPTSSTEITLYNFNVGTGSNRLLVVGVAADTQSVSSIQFGGASLTNAVSSFTNNDAELWYLKNPNGTANLVVTMGGGASSSSFVVGAYSFSGVNQTNPVPTTAANHNAAASSPTISLTTAHANDLVIDLPSIWGGVTLSSPTCTQQWNVNMPTSASSKITGASSLSLVPSPGSVTCRWTASTADLWDDVAIELKAVSLTASTGVVVPLYCDPSSADPSHCSTSPTFTWQPLIDAKGNHTRVPFFAVVNPDNGPGPNSSKCASDHVFGVNRTQQYNDGIGNLTKADISVLGYVATTNGHRSYSTVTADIDKWFSCYPKIKGIYMDEMNVVPGINNANVTYYQNLTNHIHSKGLTYSIGNPGTSIDQVFVNSGDADNLVIFENGSAPTTPQLQPNTFSATDNYLGFDKHDFSFLSHMQSSLPGGTTIGNRSNFVGLMYYTQDGSDGNPWDTISSHLSTLATKLDNQTAVITINATASSSGKPIIGALVKVSHKDDLVPGGYTPISYLGTSGVKYTFTPQQLSGTCTFNNWKDTGSATAARTILVNSTSKAYTAVYSGSGCP